MKHSVYDFRGSDDDPGELYVIEEKPVVVNHSGTALMPEKLKFPSSGRLHVEDELGFVGDVVTLEKFCQMHGIEYPAQKFKYEIKPASPDEAGLFFSQHPAEDERLGCIGHVRMDFGKNGNEFCHPQRFRSTSYSGMALHSSPQGKTAHPQNNPER